MSATGSGNTLTGNTLDGNALSGRASLRVGVIDGDRLVVEGLAALLAREGMNVVVAASGWAEYLAHPAIPVDVAVLDLHSGDGILVASRVRALEAMGSATVVISRHTDAAFVTAAMRAGALGFVAMTDSVDDLVAAVLAAAAGRTHLSGPRAHAVGTAAATPDPGLGKQEERALVLYASGRSVREVANDMKTTDQTVKSYIKRGRRKFRDIGIDIGTRVLLRRHAARAGWLNPDRPASDGASH